MQNSELSFADLTTTRVGGSPENTLVAETREQLIEYGTKLMSDYEPWIVLGGGSNTIMRDAGFPGTLLLIRTSGISKIQDSELAADFTRIRVAAGHNWDDLIVATINMGLYGLEPLSGIPGAVGAAPIQNIGAYGAELKDFFHSMELLEEETGEIRRVYAEELDFGYRDSAFKRQEFRGIILSVDLILRRSDEPGEALSEVRYQQLASALKCQIGDRRAASEIRSEVLKLRARKGMVLKEDDTDTRSTGSFFMNPIVTEKFAATLPAAAPRFPLGDDDEPDLVLPLEKVHLIDELPRFEPVTRYVKLSAAWLIEHAGIVKGFSIPGSGARISTKHTLAITNYNSATAEEIAELARFVAARVRSEYGVILIPEPNLYGLEF